MNHDSKFPEFEWRALEPEDVASVCALIAAVLAVDGGLPFAADQGFVRANYLPLSAVATLGGFTTDECLIAFTALTRPSSDAATLTTMGAVHPDSRQRGLGRFLLDWTTTQADAFFAASKVQGEQTLFLRTESLTDAAARLYARFGWSLNSAGNILRRSLAVPLPAAPLPEGITLASWRKELAGDFFQAYQDAFRDRPGFPNQSMQEWVEWASEDDDFSPERSFVAYAAGRPVAFIICEKNWIGQMGVNPAWRKQGLGTALLVEVLQRAVNDGDTGALLDVNVNNPQAAQVYSRLGFQIFGRRARFARTQANR